MMAKIFVNLNNYILIIICLPSKLKNVCNYLIDFLQQVLDEVDAPLDLRNTAALTRFLKDADFQAVVRFKKIEHAIIFHIHYN